jgi:hypothetical protein
MDMIKYIERQCGVMIGTSLSGLLLFILGIQFISCTVDLDAADPVLMFSCETDSDCLEGFVCTENVCRTFESVNNVSCSDFDQDGFLAGEGCDVCPDGPNCDCNDDPEQGGQLINPGRTEECNALDDNCNGTIDEDVAPRNCPLQAGVCTGATVSCFNGEWMDCIAEGLYGEDFENVSQDEERCDGLDNNCSGDYSEDADADDVDYHCVENLGRCIPSLTPASECGTDTGACGRGIRFCMEDGYLSPCLFAEQGEACTEDADCSEMGWCIEEEIDYREDLLDDCILGSEPSCQRQICRVIGVDLLCNEDLDCAEDEICFEGGCQEEVVNYQSEQCNGLDDDCNGRIDDGEVCGRCPYNMTYLEEVTGEVAGICIDRFEASRSDATATSAGINDLYTVSEEGVLPWTNYNSAEAADDACRGAAINLVSTLDGGIPGFTPEKFLCEQKHLQAACGETYPYGESYLAGLCNDQGSLDLTGGYSSCCTLEGVCDLVGNVAELYSTPNLGAFGGDYNDLEQLGCGYSVWFSDIILGPPSLDLGFRCCTLPLN